MTWPPMIFSLLCVVILGAAVAGIISRRGTRTSVAWFLLSMSALAGVFILLSAHVIAIAQLLFCAGLGLVCFFAIDDSADSDVQPNTHDQRHNNWMPRSWHWLIITLGVAGVSLMWTFLFSLMPGNLAGTPQHAALLSARSFETVGHTVLVDQGVAVLCVGLLLFGALIGAGYLVRRGLE